MLGEKGLKNLADRALSMSQADQTEVVIFAPHSALTRFANNYIHQNVEQRDVDIRVRAVLGKKVGVASSNDLSDEGLRSARPGPEERPAVVAQICDAASRAGLTAAGAFRTAVAEVAVANSLGVFAYHRDTMADINTARPEDH